MKILNLSVILVMLLFSSCNQQVQPIKTIMKTMHLSSTGQISYVPNEAYISISLSCVDKNITKSKDCLLKKSDELQTLIKSHGIKEKHIITTAVNQSKSHEWRNSSSVFVGYNSSLSLQLTIKNLDVLEKLYPALLSKKNISLGYLSYTHSNMDSLKTLAYQDAIDKANKLAEDLLFKIPESTKEILKIGNTSLPQGNYYDEYRNDKKRLSLSENNEIGKVKNLKMNAGTYFLSQSINVEYRIQ
ncbi:MAG: hypothetical protein ACJA0Q_002005 [Saprospiraceae bacterium]|jgi:uncharacterized protein YggE